MDAIFTQWVDGQPWWLTLMLLPVVAIVAILARLLRYAAVFAIIALMVGGVAIWLLARRR